MTSVNASRAGSANDTVEHPARWSAVYAMAVCSFVLVASEFMPVSLLSPIADTLKLSEGQAGQAISISGVFAVVTSLLISVLLGKRDRRKVMMALILLLIASGALVAFAPDYFVFMLGRALLGIAVGGFWSMSAAIAMRLVPKGAVPKALAVVNGGTAMAAVLAAPLGSFMGGVIGWRGAFFCIVPVVAVAFFWLSFTLPKLPAEGMNADRGPFSLLRKSSFVFGLVMWCLLFVGEFSAFTYLRPFLEHITHVSVRGLSMMLLVVGISGFISTFLIGRVIEKGLYLTLFLLPATLTVVTAALAIFGGSPAAVAVLLAIWGGVFTAAPVAWWTWLAHSVPDDAEAGGGLMVATGQLAITLGATFGGVVFDADGAIATFWSSSAILTIAAVGTCVLGWAENRRA
ncbi:major facilitator transporter [Pseudomonas sp. M47T1]|uniref:MFS transporter n=1 Tax=Pseudomonas sp. M47T1 TaxID=1179778 RepID=UPI0002607313|nr:MFS transporter [Pseudomonas sp. M47T1]EIK94377.1 major facilitator transporter [Pseudomonas sp. M47T1]